MQSVFLDSARRGIGVKDVPEDCLLVRSGDEYFVRTNGVIGGDDQYHGDENRTLRVYTQVVPVVLEVRFAAPDAGASHKLKIADAAFGAGVSLA